MRISHSRWGNDMETNEQLDKIHALELKIALEIKRICESNNIHYFLTAGTLLGAVRHGGFIPWDDDMDIGMLRDDYDRFVEACKKDLSPEFFMQTWDSDPNYPFSYGKLRLKGTRFVEGFSEKSDLLENGLFVDIFPFDNVPDDPAQQKKQERKYFFCKRILWIKKGMGTNMKEGSFKQKLKYYGFWIAAHIVSYERVKQYYKKSQTLFNGVPSKKVVTDGSYNYKKESILREWVENLELVKFETEEFLTYKDRIAYLTYFYGDYMKLPPEEKRNRHLLRNVDFGPYA